jgi:hypothetical protein
MCPARPSEARVWHLASADESIHQRLVSGRAELDDNVVDDRREPGIADQRETYGVCLVVAVYPLAQRDDLMRPKGVKDPRDRIDPGC